MDQTVADFVERFNDAVGTGDWGKFAGWFTDDAVIEFADVPVPEIAKKHKISEQTIDNWRRHFGGLEPADIKRLRGLETENAKLKRILAERDLEIDTLKEINRRKW